MTYPFQQPDWVQESGKPYPGTEVFAEAFQKNMEFANDKALAKSEARKVRIRKQGEEIAKEEEESLRQFRAIRADSIQTRRTKWLWRDRVPLGGLSLLAGKGAVSKSTLFAQFAAWITIGDMKGEFYGAPRNVCYVVNEDSIEETVVPRLLAHGADLSRVFFLTVHTPLGKDALSLPHDEQRLADFIREHNIAVTFVDPLSANVSGKANDQREIRHTYQIVNGIAERTNSSIFGLAHTRKADARDVIEAVIGSSEQTNVARSVHGLVMDPEEDDARILSCEKLNVGQMHLLPSLRFRLNSVEIPCDDGTYTHMPRIEWLEEIMDRASDVLGDLQDGGHSNIDDCVRWLDQFLLAQGGEARCADIKEAGKKFSERMLQRARKRLGVKSKRVREAQAGTVWTHPLNHRE
jgi:hypothetical protein